jgi:hypothetical protein
LWLISPLDFFSIFQTGQMNSYTKVSGIWSAWELFWNCFIKRRPIP